jgi:hypothetical protein
VSAASQRFAEQLLTAMATLVTSIAAFYFGARAVEAARGTKPVVTQPVIRNITPGDGHQGRKLEDVEIRGKDFRSPTTVQLVLGSAEMAFSEVISNSALIRCKLMIPASQQIGKYDLIVVNADGGEDRLPEAFEVTSTPQEEPTVLQANELQV